MAFTANNVYKAIVIEENGLIRVRVVRRIYEDGALAAEKITALILEPGQDVSAYPAKVRNTCAVWWDQATIDAYNAQKAAGSV